MSKKRVLLFFTSILLLIVSEYLLLNELLEGKITLPVVLSGSSLLASLFFTIRFYKEWLKSMK